jgi:5'(3')-deoxyribonucleotidase
MATRLWETRLQESFFGVDTTMDDERFVLGVDLDGVCADFYGGLRKVAAEWLNVPLSSLPTNVSYGLPEWNLDKAGGYEDLHRFAVTQRELFRRLKPLPRAPVVLRRLSKKKVRIRIITHRFFIKYFHQEAARQTIEWLDNYDIPYWDLCFVMDKTAVGADLYVEDSPKNIASLRDQKLTTIIFANSTNRKIPGLRATSWPEVEKIVLKELGRWKRDLSHKKS